ncbi:MAG: GTPase [Nonlabens sp.]
MESHLIFVYNANSGRLNAWIDSAHKIVSPSTYKCRLCDLTYDVFKENEEWLRFRESGIFKDIQLEFLHIDEFEETYWSKWLPRYTYPIILKKSQDIQDYNDGFGTNSGLEILMSAEQMNKIHTTGEFIEHIKKLGIA